MTKITTKQRPSNLDKSLWVLTPVGYRKRDRVIRLKKGQIASMRIDTKQWELIEPKGKISTFFPSVLPEPGPYDGGQDWVSYGEIQTTTDVPFTLSSSTWKVPEKPTNNNEQTIYLFNAFQHVNESGIPDYIIQPVLIYGEYPAPNGEESDTKGNWMIASFWVPGNGTQGPILVSPGVTQVNPGDELTGIISLKSTDSGTYLYNCYFDGHDETLLSVGTPLLSISNQVLEIWGVTERSQLPPDTKTSFYNIQTLINDSQVSMPWTPEGDAGCMAVCRGTAQVDVIYPK